MVKAIKPRGRAGRFQILALSGGGFRGLYTASVLEALEKTMGGRRLRDAFDLIAGTSIGGIIAIGVAGGIPAREIRAAIEKHGPLIFAAKKARGAFAAKYSPTSIRDTLDAILGSPDRRLASLERAVFIPAVNRTTGAATAFSHVPGDAVDATGTPLLSDVAMATAAALIFFPVHRVGDAEYIDGGIFANAPEMSALAFATESLGVPAQRIHVLAVGTTYLPAGQAPLADRDRGLTQWMTESELVELTFASQESNARGICEVLLGRRYLRLDRAQHRGHADSLGLDKATPEAVKILRTLARETMAELSDGRRADFLGHIVRT